MYGVRRRYWLYANGERVDRSFYFDTNCFGHSGVVRLVRCICFYLSIAFIIVLIPVLLVPYRHVTILLIPVSHRHLLLSLPSSLPSILGHLIRSIPSRLRSSGLYLVGYPCVFCFLLPVASSIKQPSEWFIWSYSAGRDETPYRPAA